MSVQRKSFRTPLGRVRALGSARQGTQDALVMRATSIALVPLSVAFIVLMLSLLHKDYNGVRAAIGHPLPAVLVLLFVLVGVYHTQVGMRSVIVDYLHGHAREWALILNLFVAAALGMACVYATLRIGFV